MRQIRIAWVLAALGIAGLPLAKAGDVNARPSAAPQRVVIVLFDGLGPDYVEQSAMPVLKKMMREGFSKTVQGVMPSVTNCNNASLCCGAWPEEHGITGNSYFDEKTGKAEYMEDASFLRTPTIFERASRLGVKSALLTSKKKTLGFLARGADIAVSAESPPPNLDERLGKAPEIYSREINYWLWEAAIDLLKNQPEIGCLYVHTTDYPMHTWPPSAEESKTHLATVDGLIGKAIAAAPDAAFLITADHGMNFKTRCWDLEKACHNKGLDLRFALAASRDRYVKHHRNFGGTAWVWLKDAGDASKAMQIIRGLDGVQEVLTRDEACRRFHLMPERTGELVVLGDKDTVFGDMDTEREALPPTYRNHGSTHELDVPLIVYNYKGKLPPAEEIRHNFELTRFLFRGSVSDVDR
jgi:phosphonoacetate hydrolase